MILIKLEAFSKYSIKLCSSDSESSKYFFDNIMERHFAQKSRFYYERFRCITKGRDFNMNGSDVLRKVEIIL